MSQTYERHTISFVLRLWTEPMQQEGERRWRGQLEHVGSGEKAYFQVPETLLFLLTEHINVPIIAEAEDKASSLGQISG